jgi:hypothetical protein
LDRIIQEKLIPKLKLVDLSQLTVENAKYYHPRILENLCYGYLRLVQLDTALYTKLVNMVRNETNLSLMVKDCVKRSTPTEIETSRIIVNFMCKLKLQNEMLFDWLTCQ